MSPQFREFERFTTAAINAFIGPTVHSYVTLLEQRLRRTGLQADLNIMCSNGGVATPAMVAEKPVLTLLSGPAAGVLGGAWSGALSQRSRLITFDMGGTSADIGVVTNGTFSEATARDTWIAGYPAMVPMIDIHTIGAGGGSIATIDAGGAFRVGPQSAGSHPGPAAYGHGGTAPTVTDANVVLGRIDKDNFLGEMPLDDAVARQVIHQLAQRLGLSDIEAAEGIITIVNNKVCVGIGNLKVIAASGFRSNRPWVHLEIFEGSYGGRYGRDGMDAVDTLYANTRNNPIEDIESHVPLRVERYELREDACAPGQWRGGLASIKTVRYLSDGGASVEGDGFAYGARGYDGGGTGFPGKLILQIVDGEEISLPSKVPYRSVKTGDLFIAVGATGGGYGDPLRRDPHQVLEDVRDGYYSVAAAERDYGVIITESMQLDKAAAAACRHARKEAIV